MSSEPLDPRVAAVEAALARLAPAPANLDRDRLLYLAGRASAGGRQWAWPTVTAAAMLLAAGLGIALALRPAPPVVERIVTIVVKEPAPPVPEAPSEPPAPRPVVVRAEARDPDWSDYLRLRQQVSRWGVDALPAPRSMHLIDPPGASRFDDPEQLLDRPGWPGRHRAREPGGSS